MKKISLLFIMLVSIASTGCSTLADARTAKGTGATRVYDATPDAVWTALPKAVKDVGLDYVGDNRNDGYALAQRGMSAFSYGENVAMFVEPTGSKDKTKVEVVSKKTLATNVFATNWESVILDKLATIFPSVKPQVSGEDLRPIGASDASLSAK